MMSFPSWLLFRRTQSVCVLVEHDVSVVTYILTHSDTSPCCEEDVGVVVLIMIPHDFAYCLGGFSAVIEGYPGAEMVCNMGLHSPDQPSLQTRKKIKIRGKKEKKKERELLADVDTSMIS